MGLGLLNIARNDNGENLNKQITKNVRYKPIVGNMEDRVGNKLLMDSDEGISSVNNGLGTININGQNIMDKIKNRKVINANNGLGSLGSNTWWLK